MGIRVAGAAGVLLLVGFVGCNDSAEGDDASGGSSSSGGASQSKGGASPSGGSKSSGGNKSSGGASPSGGTSTFGGTVANAGSAGTDDGGRGDGGAAGDAGARAVSSGDSTDPTHGGQAGSDGSEAGDGGQAMVPTGPVTVTVVDSQGTPTVGAAVVFYDAQSGSPVIVMTDTNGEATHQVVPNACINVAFERSTPLSNDTFRIDRQLATFIDVQPGDDLRVLDDTTSWLPKEDAAHINVVFTPPVGPDCEQDLCSYFDVGVTCGNQTYYASSETSSIQVGVGSDCLGVGVQATIVVQAEDSNARSQFRVMNGVTIVDDATYTVDTWSVGRSYDLTVSGVPVDLGRLILRGDFYRTGTALWGDLVGATSTTTNTLHLELPATDVDTVVQNLSLERTTEFPRCAATSKRITRELPSGPAPFDLSQLLPPIHKPSLVLGTGGVVQQINWEADPALASTDGTMVMLEYNVLPEHEEDDTLHGYWTIVAPAGLQRVSPPPMPLELSDVAYPGPYAVKDVSEYQSSDFASYAEFRHAFGRKFGEYVGSDERPAPEGPSSVVLRAGIQCQ